ncbi:MAG TPA: hypothetical protein VJ720_13950, partial [Chitinophaga sp.]|nr:hypothetical protein [Chitinophaga sp.]
IGNISAEGKFSIGNGLGVSPIPSGSYIIINRKTDIALDQNEHSFQDLTIFEKSVAAKAHASYDARTIIQGSVNYDHYAAFQSLPEFKGSGVMTNLYGAYIAGVISAGTVTNRYGIIIQDITGAGALTTNYGIFINNLTKGTNNYSIYTGTAVTRLGGDLRLHNVNTAVGTGSLIDFRAGSGSDGTGIVLAQILSELIGSTTQANLHFKVRTGAGTPPAGMTEILTLLGGSSFGVGINQTAPAARLHVNGSTRLDIGSDATGDILYRSSTGILARLGLDTAGKQLRINSGATAPEWVTPGIFPISVFTASSVSINSADWGVVMNNSANATVTLPAASSVSGRTFWIKKGLPNAFTVTITAAEQGVDVVLTSENDAILVQSDGSQYYVIARKQAPAAQNIRILADFYTDQGNTSTTPNTYTELYGYTMPANTLTANGQKIVCRYSGRFAANANDKGLQVFVGSTGIGTNVWVGGGHAYWAVEAMIIRTGTSTARATVSFLEGSFIVQSDLTSLDFTASIDIDLWGTSGAGAVNDVVAKLGSIEWKTAAS